MRLGDGGCPAGVAPLSDGIVQPQDFLDARCALLYGLHRVNGTTKSKLAILKSLDPTPAGSTLIGAWHQLTGFCHQHAYQLSPAVAEVRAECSAIKRDCLG